MIHYIENDSRRTRCGLPTGAFFARDLTRNADQVTCPECRSVIPGPASDDGIQWEKYYRCREEDPDKKIKELGEIIKDHCETDRNIREIAKKYLDAEFVDGDTSQVPPLESIVEELIANHPNR